MNNGAVKYPETEEKDSTPAWVWPIAAFIYATVGAAGVHLGWNLMGLLW